MNICLSGGSKGADYLFGHYALENGHKVTHWSFLNHHSTGRKEDTVVLSYVKLMKADEHLKKANEYLLRTFPTRSEYVNNLLRRNYYQVCGSERVYAVCRFEDDMKPIGGTSWAIVMAIHFNISEIYVFNMSNDKWSKFNRKYFNTLQIYKDEWEETDLFEIPKPHGIYTGIGASELTFEGRDAIWWLYNPLENNL